MNPSSSIVKTLLLALTFCLFSPGQTQLNRQDMINWRTYQRGLMSNAKNTETYVFETEGQFQSYWQRVIGPLGGKMPSGGIDWSKEKLVAVNLGSRPNPGYEVAIVSIKRVRAAEIQVTFQEKLPMQGFAYPNMVVSPFVIAKMERNPGTISFKGESVKNNIGFYGTGGSCCGAECRCCENCTCCRRDENDDRRGGRTGGGDGRIGGQ